MGTLMRDVGIWHNTGKTLAGHQYVVPSSSAPPSSAGLPILFTLTQASEPSLVNDQGSSSTVLPARVATEAVRRRPDAEMDSCDEGSGVSVLAERARGGGGIVDGSSPWDDMDVRSLSLSSESDEVDEIESALFRFVGLILLDGAFGFPFLGAVEDGFFAGKARAVPPVFLPDFPRNGLFRWPRPFSPVSSSDNEMGLSARLPLALFPGDETSALRLARGRFRTLFPFPGESSEDFVGELGPRLRRPYVTLTGVRGLEGSPNSRARLSDGGGELSS